jgi:hypothetical protein
MDLLQNDLWLFLLRCPRLSFQSPSVDYLLGEGLLELPKNLSHYDKAYLSYQVTEAGTKALAGLDLVEVHAGYTEDWSTVTERSETDEWDQGEDSANSRFESVTTDKSGAFGLSKSFRVPKALLGKELTLIWCHYGTGDTFGHTYGKFDVGNVYTTPEGKKLIENELTRDHDDYFGGVEDFFEETVVLTAPE